MGGLKGRTSKDLYDTFVDIFTICFFYICPWLAFAIVYLALDCSSTGEDHLMKNTGQCHVAAVCSLVFFIVTVILMLLNILSEYPDEMVAVFFFGHACHQSYLSNDKFKECITNLRGRKNSYNMNNNR